MEIAIAGGAFFGAVLGRFFRVFVLIPAGALAIALLLMKTEIAEHTWLHSLLGIGLLIASLDLGYVTGLISSYVPPRNPPVTSFRGFPARPGREAPPRPTRRR